MLAITTFGCGFGRERHTEIYSRADSGQYVFEAIFDGSVNVPFELGQMPDGRKLLFGGTRTESSWPIFTMLETEEGTWAPVQTLPETSPKTHAFYEGQLFVFDTTFTPDPEMTTLTPRLTCCFLNFIKVYELSSNSERWVQTQTLNFNRNSVGAHEIMNFSGNKLGVVRSDDNWLDIRLMDATVTLFEKDSANQWSILYESDFVGPEPYQDGGRNFTSSTFAGDNLFLSVMDNEVENIRFYPGETSTPSETSNVEIGNCDYSDADLYDGWGWNAVAGQSCPPLQTGPNNQTPSTSDSSSACIDADSDGFGWNGVATCNPSESTNTVIDNQPSVGQCIDADGDGFGWDGFATCVPLASNASNSMPQALQCIDTDGDGFGWNGFATCDP